ncbi:chaperone modulator CbpM [Desulfotruncus alcoholivorax]|uniref:chaperone modulator CbpM n=1 Tax=Desulfotruncus alcoholivorax TaxID=265477 RepID=UPI00040E74B0|nr:chaperone modulator CbpM [Desulfotruncus alcoholivorax]
MKKYYLELYRHTLTTADDEALVDLESLGVHPGILELLAEFGVIELRQGRIRADQAARAEKIMRLRRNLGVNLPGAAIILELLERIEELQDQIEHLKRR